MSNYQQSDYEEKVIRVSRVSKKTKGGDQMGFSVLMVVGDRKGRVGVGLGKAKDVVSSIRKGVRKAKKNMIEVPIKDTTIPFQMRGKHGAGEVLLKPAVQGSGVIAGGPVRAVVEAAGIKDISAKILGSDNQASSVYATFDALKKIRQVIKVRGIKVEQAKSDQDSKDGKDAKGKSFSKKAKKSKKKSVEKSKADKKSEANKKVKSTKQSKAGKKVKTGKQSKAEKISKKEEQSKAEAAKKDSPKEKKSTKKTAKDEKNKIDKAGKNKANKKTGKNKSSKKTGKTTADKKAEKKDKKKPSKKNSK